jgi:hypothetical protein
MADAARAGSTAASAGGLALAVLCAQQFSWPTTPPSRLFGQFLAAIW